MAIMLKLGNLGLKDFIQLVAYKDSEYVLMSPKLDSVV